MENLDQFPVSPEQQEEFSSKIELSFFRHGEKKNDREKSDFDIELTEEGKRQAVEKSEDGNPEQSVAFGSPRARAQETAAFVMAGSEEAITGEESLDELRGKLDKGLDKGSKVGVDERLNFDLDIETPYGEKAFESFKNGEYLKFLVEQSDQLAEKLSDGAGFTYSRGASNIASMIDKYVKVAKRWDELANDESKEYSDTLERFFGTHMGVNEAFLAKLIEKTKGVEERDEFVQVLGGHGFDFTEGFEVEILNKDSEEPIIHINYKKEKEGESEETVFEFSEEVSLGVIHEIIDEGAHQ